MNGHAWIHLIPYLASFALSGGISVYAWQRRNVTGAAAFTVYTFIEAITTLFFVFEVISHSLNGKILWDDMQFVGILYTPVVFCVFTYQYAGLEWRHARRVLVALIALATICLLIVLTDHYHHLIRTDARLEQDTPFSVMTYSFTLTFFVIVATGYLELFAAFYILIAFLRRNSVVYRHQVLAVILGLAIPIVGGFLTMIGVKFGANRDTSPFTIAIGNLAVAWGLFRFQLFDLVPVARDRVVESMTDAVVVLDAQTRLVDLNPAAAQILGRSPAEVIGLPAIEVFSAWTDVVAQFEGVEQANADITVEVRGVTRHFHLRLSRLSDRRGSSLGTVIVVRDITEAKQAQEELRRYRDQLEDLVQQRTEELITARTAFAVERARLAQDLHDSVTQTIFAANTIAEMLPQMLTRGPEKTAEYMTELSQLTRGAMAEMRILMIELRPGALARTELGVLIKQLCDAVAGSTRVLVKFSATEKLILQESKQIAFYRVAQAALDNSARYARASHIEVRLSKQDRTVELYVHDNGRGFDPHDTMAENQIGIKSMQDHADRVGAHLTVFSKPGEGTTITLVGTV